jgi:TP901-1 family phage major tail protein
VAEIAGVDILLKVNTGTIAAPTWTTVGGQRNCTLNRSGDEIDSSDKTTGGWKKKVTGLIEWSMDCDVVLQDTDNAYAALEAAFNTRQQIQVQIAYPASAGGKTRTGMACISNLGEEMPYDGISTAKLALAGNGALTTA